MPRFRPERLLDDWAAKVLSLVAAGAIFAFFQLNRLEERPLSVTLTVLENEQFSSATVYPDSVTLVLRGEPDAIYAVGEDDFQATLDLRGFEVGGTYRVPVSVLARGAAASMDSMEVSAEPRELSLVLEPRVSRRLDVLPSFRGYLEPGYELADFTLEPSSVEVAGPASVVDGLADLSTEPVELSGRSEDFDLRVRIVVDQPLVDYVSEEWAQFSAEVRKAVVYRTFEDVPIQASGLADGLSLASDLPAGSARVLATRAELDAMDAGGASLRADLSGVAGAGVYTVAVTPAFPDGVSVESWQPLVITITVTGQAAAEDQ